jgi:hypothetical protein
MTQAISFCKTRKMPDGIGNHRIAESGGGRIYGYGKVGEGTKIRLQLY